jgi:hypothetical protein
MVVMNMPGLRKKRSIMPAMRGFFFRLSSIRSLLAERNAISLPEKKADKAMVAMMTGRYSILGDGAYFNAS